MFCLQNKFISVFKLLMLTLVISPVYAANINQETVDITAHYLLLDEKNGVSKYKGDVYFKKGTLSIKADEVTLYFNDGKLTKAMILGSPADVLHYPDNEAKVHSQAKEMEYFVTEDRLTLKGQAFVDQGDRHFSGESIEYDTRQRTITASGNQNKTINTENSPPKSRVHVIIGPSKDGNDSADGEDTENSTNDKNKDQIADE